MTQTLAVTVIVFTSIYFIALALATLIMPVQANRFLLGFASSPFTHYTELSLRFVVGSALVLYAPHMFLSGAFSVFGWMLLVTTAGLLLVPWRWHRRFAHKTVPWAMRHMRLVGLSSFVLGGFILAAVIRGSAA